MTTELNAGFSINEHLEYVGAWQPETIQYHILYLLSRMSVGVGEPTDCSFGDGSLLPACEAREERRSTDAAALLLLLRSVEVKRERCSCRQQRGKPPTNTSQTSLSIWVVMCCFQSARRSRVSSAGLHTTPSLPTTAESSLMRPLLLAVATILRRKSSPRSRRTFRSALV